jgi:hypothetical protein
MKDPIRRTVTIFAALLILTLSSFGETTAFAGTTHTTAMAFKYTITLYPTNSSWRAEITNVGSSVIWAQLTIENSTMRQNEFLQTGFQIMPGHSGSGSYKLQCYFFGKGYRPCPMTKGATYQFCPSSGDNMNTTALDYFHGCVNVRANGVAVQGSTSPRMNLTWSTSIVGGSTAKWHFSLKNVGTQSVNFVAILSWPCLNPDPNVGWTTCSKQSANIQLTPGHTTSFTLSFKPMFHSLPSNTRNITATVLAKYSPSWILSEGENGLVAS